MQAHWYHGLVYIAGMLPVCLCGRYYQMVGPSKDITLKATNITQEKSHQVMIGKMTWLSDIRWTPGKVKRSIDFILGQLKTAGCVVVVVVVVVLLLLLLLLLLFCFDDFSLVNEWIGFFVCLFVWCLFFVCLFLLHSDNITASIYER